MENFNVTSKQKEHLTELIHNCSDLWEILNYFQSIRPKAYNRLLKRKAKSYGVHDINDATEWDALLCDEAMDDIVLDAMNEIRRRCGIE